MDHLCFFVSCVSHSFASVHCCLVVTCWERADLLALVGDVLCILVTFFLSFFLYILPGARFRALSAGVHCTLRVCRMKAYK